MPMHRPLNRYPNGTKVRVTDVRYGVRRKYIGKVLWVNKRAKDGSPSSWAVKLSKGGNTACYDLDQIERVE